MAKNQDVLVENNQAHAQTHNQEQAKARNEQPKHEEALPSSPQGSKNRKETRVKQIALIQRQEDGAVRVSFEADEHGARPGPMMLNAEEGKKVPDGDDRGYICEYDDGSYEWKASAEVEKNRQQR
jgi:hypothetical protein